MSAVDEYQAATEQLATQTARDALAVYADLTTGRIPPDDAALLIAALINRANASATALADVWLSVQIEQLAGEPVPTVGVLPADSSERLAKAANTVLSDRPDAGKVAGQDQLTDSSKKIGADERTTINSNDDGHDQPEGGPSAAMRLERLARSEVFEAAQQATHDAMQQQPLVEGWIRQMDADPCQLCVWWWRDGRVWPKAHPMPRHKGCNCQPKVVLAERIKSTVFTRRLRGTHE